MILSTFELISGLKVNQKKTVIYHSKDNSVSICDWQLVKSIKILGILFPTSSREHIKTTTNNLQNQLAFWKRLKIPLYTKIVLLNTYTKFQFSLPRQLHRRGY